MAEQMIYVPVTLHRDDGYADVALLVPLLVPLDLDLDAEWLIDDVLDSARLQAKDLLRPYLNNQAYYQVDTPAIPQHVNQWARGVSDGPESSSRGV